MGLVKGNNTEIPQNTGNNRSNCKQEAFDGENGSGSFFTVCGYDCYVPVRGDFFDMTTRNITLIIAFLKLNGAFANCFCIFSVFAFL